MQIDIPQLKDGYHVTHVSEKMNKFTYFVIDQLQLYDAKLLRQLSQLFSPILRISKHKAKD